ncbi:apolipoprotein N-acyltransferase [Kitasatospora sp. NPDC051853]|uniref:apolipoprotein N-acyltransferase n=1 Tax=Kitasatospora sp. NPDC051853 TaxID=3364058 RepID=UPI0037AC79E4
MSTATADATTDANAGRRAAAPPAPPRWRRPGAAARLRLPLAPLGGLLTAAAFPPLGLWPLAVLGPALLLTAVRGVRARTAFLAGTAYGLAFFGPMLLWLRNLGAAPWLGLTLAQSLLWGLLAIGLPALWRLRGAPFWLACWWVAAEAVRSRFPLGGFPWGRLAFSQADAPTLGWVSVLGVPGLGGLLAFTAACLALLLTTRGRGLARRIITFSATAATALAGVLLLPSATGGPSATVAAVQGNVPRERTLAEQARVRQVTANHVAATDRLADDIGAGRVPRPDLVVWPENSTDTDPRPDRLLSHQIGGAVDRLGVPVLVGAILDGPDGRIRNAGLLWRPVSGPGEWYAKQHLVPFGEYIPLRDTIGGLGDLQLIPRDFVPGTGPAVFRVGPVTLADSICYEVGYDSQVRNAVRAGANLLAVQTNNATYMRDGSLGEPRQQLDIARVRAVEHDRSVVLASTTGISATITPDGRTTARTAPWQQSYLVASLPLRTTTTPAAHLGPWPEALLTTLAAAALLLPALRRRTAVLRRTKATS